MIETDRLVLRGWGDADRPRWVEICGDAEVMRHVGDGRARTPAEADLQVDRFIATWRDHGYGPWALERRDRPGCIGFCGLLPLAGGGVEIGWRLARAEWGQGIATEAALPARDRAFERLHWLDRLIARFRPENTASQRVMEKLGMAYAADDVDEHSLPVRTYELTRAAWGALRG